jgi:hypothetical protein
MDLPMKFSGVSHVSTVRPAARLEVTITMHRALQLMWQGVPRHRVVAQTCPKDRIAKHPNCCTNCKLFMMIGIVHGSDRTVLMRVAKAEAGRQTVVSSDSLEAAPTIQSPLLACTPNMLGDQRAKACIDRSLLAGRLRPRNAPHATPA